MCLCENKSIVSNVVVHLTVLYSWGISLAQHLTQHKNKRRHTNTLRLIQSHTPAGVSRYQVVHTIRSGGIHYSHVNIVFFGPPPGFARRNVARKMLRLFWLSLLLGKLLTRRHSHSCHLPHYPNPTPTTPPRHYRIDRKLY